MIRICKRISHAVQLLIHLANDAARTQIHNDLCLECGGYRQGYVELRSIAFYSRQERGRWRQGPRCLRCSKLRRIGGLGGLMMTPRRSSGCGACIPELTTRRRRHRGRSQAPWTIVMLVRKPSQSIHTSRETYTFRRRSRMPYVFSRPPLLVGDTVEVVSWSATSRVQSLPRHHCTTCTLVSPANCM